MANPPNATQRRNLMQTTGTIRPLVLLVKWQGHEDRAVPSLEQVTELFSGSGTSDVIPTGSIREFLASNSYQRVTMDAGILDWTVTDQSEAHYSYGQSGLTLATAQSMHAVLNYWQSQGMDFSPYDQDNDGVIDATIMLHSGYPAEIAGNDCQTGATEQYRIWSHAIAHATSYTWQGNGIMVGPYVIGSALRGTCGSNINRIGVLTHEFIHLWNMPDLYDTFGDWIGKGVGSYDIMGNPYGLTNDHSLPSNVGPWTKIRLGWLEPLVITKDALYTIEPSATSPQVYKIQFSSSPNEYLLIENRQAITWDAALAASGLIIWHIDESAPGQRHRGYPDQEGWPSNGRHYQVAVLQADGRYDLEVGTNQGDAGDFYVQGFELSPAPIEYDSVTKAFHPSSNSYHLGQIQQTGIRIYEISGSGTGVMTFRVSGVSTVTDPPTVPPTTPAPTPPPTVPPTPPPTVPPTVPPTPPPTIPPTPPPTAAPVSVPTAAGQTPPPVTPPPTTSPTPAPVTPPPSPAPVTPPPTASPTTSPTTPPPTPSPTVPPTTPPPAPLPTRPPTVEQTTSVPLGPTPPPIQLQTMIPVDSPSPPPVPPPVDGATSGPPSSAAPISSSPVSLAPTAASGIPASPTVPPTVTPSPVSPPTDGENPTVPPTTAFAPVQQPEETPSPTADDPLSNAEVMTLSSSRATQLERILYLLPALLFII